jgi:hypothetical protein
MIVQLDPKTRIKGTERAWELQRQRNYKGGTKWESYKWFTTFRCALEEAVQREIRTHPAIGLADAIEAVSSIVQRYTALIPAEYRFTRQRAKPGD